MILSQQLDQHFESWEENLWLTLYDLSASLVAYQKCIDQKLKSADNPYVLTNFCKLLSLTYCSI